MGENTFGKGLVQTVYPLAQNTGLALTTAHFYTPSGRLIQRDYTNTSFYNYYYRKDTETKNPLDVKTTDSGRTVYGGGGISPDEKFAAPKLNKFQQEMLRKYTFFTFAARYFGQHGTDLPKNWAPDNALMNDFHEFLLKSGVEFTEADYAENHEWLKQQLRREMYITAFGMEDARRLAVETDPAVRNAVDAMPRARTLRDNAKKLIVQRQQAGQQNRKNGDGERAERR
jgi:carboxyl-terminal processing protease